MIKKKYLVKFTDDAKFRHGQNIQEGRYFKELEIWVRNSQTVFGLQRFHANVVRAD